MGEATESIEITSTRDELVTGFNTHYLLDALASMPGEHCQVYMDSPLAPCLLTTPERPEWHHIVMPLKV
jgi:DNA polymerase III sliding clamp (beta) subunit (PCNA family)